MIAMFFLKNFLSVLRSSAPRKRSHLLMWLSHPARKLVNPLRPEKPKVSKPISRPVVSLQEKAQQEKIDQQYQQALAEREEYLTSVEEDDDLRVYEVSRKNGKLFQRIVKKGEKPQFDEETAYGYNCIIRLPPIDIGDAFNNFSGKKVRIFKG